MQIVRRGPSLRIELTRRRNEVITLFRRADAMAQTGKT